MCDSGVDGDVSFLRSTRLGEQSHLFQKRRSFLDSFLVGRIQLSVSMLLRLLRAQCSRYHSVSRGSMMYASADLWRRKNGRGALMSPAEALHQYRSSVDWRNQEH